MLPWITHGPWRRPSASTTLEESPAQRPATLNAINKRRRVNFRIMCVKCGLVSFYVIAIGKLQNKHSSEKDFQRSFWKINSSKNYLFASFGSGPSPTYLPSL